MTTTSTTPERLRHHEFEAEPFTPAELSVIHRYEAGVNPDGTDGMALVQDLVDTVDFNKPGRDGSDENWPVKDQIDSYFHWLNEWFGGLDYLRSRLRNGGAYAQYGMDGGAVIYSPAAASYLRAERAAWSQKLHEVRQEACKFAFGDAGPTVTVAGDFTFFDIPGSELDGTIAAESQ